MGLQIKQIQMQRCFPLLLKIPFKWLSFEISDSSLIQIPSRVKEKALQHWIIINDSDTLRIFKPDSLSSRCLYRI